MGLAQIDLIVGSDLGGWAVSSVDPLEVRQVTTNEPKIAEMARDRGMRVLLGNINELPLLPGAIGLAIHYAHILKETALKSYQKVYNLHPGYLPWGRGWYPIFWALFEGTPAGATLHEMTLGLDKGPIVDQMTAAYTDDDTGGSLFRAVREVEKALFWKYWPQLVAGQTPRTVLPQSGGSYHSRADFYAIKEGEAWRTMSGEKLVRLARCLTIDRYPGVIVNLGARKYELVIRALEE